MSILRKLDSNDPRVRIAQYLHLHAEVPHTAQMLVQVDDDIEHSPELSHANKVYGYMDDLVEMGAVEETTYDGNRAWKTTDDVDLGRDDAPETPGDWLFEQHWIVTTTLLSLVGVSVVLWAFGWAFGLTFPVSWERTGASLLPFGVFGLLLHVYMAHRDTNTPLGANPLW